MKKILIAIIVILILPNIVFAENIEEDVLLSSTTKYYKTVYNNVSIMNNIGDNGITIEISEYEYESASLLAPYALSESEYKKLTTNIYSSGSAYKYEAVLDWKKMPKARSYDIIGIGFYESVTVDGGLSFKQKYCSSSTSCKTSSTHTGKIGVNGASAVFKLPSGTLMTLTQTLSFKVKKAGNYTIGDQKAVGDYSHAQSSITESLAKEHSVNPDSGIILSSSASSKYDELRAAVATWNGTW